jgi:hypothetical protein
MKIQEQDRFHGPALMQIVEHKSFKALNRASNRYGHYLINTDRQVFVKYRTNKTQSWTFVFQPDELQALRSALKSGDKVYVCLVCGTVTICCLSEEELKTVIDPTSTMQQSVRVDVPKGGSCHVSGSRGALPRVVPHNSFPEKVFT